jgi:ABC-2 type transport system permease protein
MVQPYITAAGANLAEEPFLLGMKKDKDSLKVLMPGVTGITASGHGPFSASPLLMTVEQTWLKAGKLVTDSTAPVYSPQEGDIKGAFPTAFALTRQVNNRQQRIIVCSDADFMSNLRNGGGFLSRACYSWLNEGAFPIYTPRPDPKDNLLRITPAGVDVLKIIYIWVLPALILLAGAILLIRRKRE